IRGSLFKRRAVWEPDRRRQHVQRSVRAYAEARRLSGRASYGALNAFATTFVLASPLRRRSLERDIDQYAMELQSRTPSAPRDFWHFVEAGDVLVVRSTIHGAFDESTIERSLAAFNRARDSGPSPREWASVCDQVAFLAAMTSDSRLPCFNEQTALALLRIGAVLDPTRD